MGIIRKNKRIIIYRNPNNGTADNLGSTDEIHNLSDVDGSVESLYCEETVNHHCGCFGTPGGRCSECGVVSCIRCHQHCGGTNNPNPIGCGSSLCREHSHYLTLADGQSLPFCKDCYGKITRKERRQKVGRVLLSAFVEQEDEQ